MQIILKMGISNLKLWAYSYTKPIHAFEQAYICNIRNSTQSCSRVGSTIGSCRAGSGPEYFNLRRVGSGTDAGVSGRVHVPGFDLTRHFYAPSICV